MPRLSFFAPAALPALFLATAITAPLSAQDAPNTLETPNAPEAPDTVSIRTEANPPIDVIGERPLSPREISRSVHELAQSNTVNEPIQRYHDPICLSVAGLGTTLNTRVAERIESNAKQASLEIEKPGCRANALVMVVDNPGKLIKRMRSWQPLLFGPRINQEIRAALSRKDPVIGWNSTSIRNARGGATNQAGGVVGAAGIALFNNADANIPTNNNCIPSRFVSCFSYARKNSIVIFDLRKLEDVHIDQLAEYANMYLIGSPRSLLDHDKLRGASIMTLFEDGPRNAPIGLTRLDRAYLKGLYTLKPNECSQRLARSTKAAYSKIGSSDDNCADGGCSSGD